MLTPESGKIVSSYRHSYKNSINLTNQSIVASYEFDGPVSYPAVIQIKVKLTIIQRVRFPENACLFFLSVFAPDHTSSCQEYMMVSSDTRNIPLTLKLANRTT